MPACTESKAHRVLRYKTDQGLALKLSHLPTPLLFFWINCIICIFSFPSFKLEYSPLQFRRQTIHYSISILTFLTLFPVYHSFKEKQRRGSCEKCCLEWLGQWLYVLEGKLPERIQNQTMMALMTMKTISNASQQETSHCLRSNESKHCCQGD